MLSKALPLAVAFSLVVTGVTPFSLVNDKKSVITVKADSDGAGFVPSTSATGTGGVNYKIAGYRFKLIPKRFLLDKYNGRAYWKNAMKHKGYARTLDFDNAIAAEKSSVRDNRFSVVVMKDSDRKKVGKGKNHTIRCKKTHNSNTLIEQTTAKDFKTLWGTSQKGFNAYAKAHGNAKVYKFVPNCWKTKKGTPYLKLTQNNNFLGYYGPFDIALTGSKGEGVVKHFIKYVRSHSKTKGHKDYLKGKHYTDYMMIVEPVIFGNSSVHGNKYGDVCLSWQDLQGNKEGTKWTPAFANAINCSKTSPKSYLIEQNKKGISASALRTILKNSYRFSDNRHIFSKQKYPLWTEKNKSYTYKNWVYTSGQTFNKSNAIKNKKIPYLPHWNNTKKVKSANLYSLWDTGFGLQGINKAAGAKMSVNYILRYNGTADENTSVKPDGTNMSVIAVSSSDKDTIHPDVKNFKVSSKTKGLTVRTYGGSVKSLKSAKKAGDKIYLYSTGLDMGKDTTEGWKKLKNDYSCNKVSARTILFNNGVKGTIEKVITLAQDSKQDFSKITMKSKKSGVKKTGAKLSTGYTYSLTCANNVKNAKSLGDSVASIMLDADTKFGKDKGIIKQREDKNDAYSYYAMADTSVSSKQQEGSAVNASLLALQKANEVQTLQEDKKGTFKGVTTKVKKKGKESRLGLSVSLYVKKKNVKSRLRYAVLDKETGKIVSHSSDIPSISYDIGAYGEFKVPNMGKGTYKAIIVPNTASYHLNKDNDEDKDVNGKRVFRGSNFYTRVANEFQINGNISAKQMAKVFADAYGVSEKDIIAGDVTKSDILRLGATASDAGKSTGYSVFLLNIKGNKLQPHETTHELKDYELNYIFPTMCDRNENTNKYDFAKLNSSKSYEFTGVYRPVGCGHYVDQVYKVSTAKKVKTTSKYKGAIIDYNKDKLSGVSDKNILRYDGLFPSGGRFITEQQARDGYMFSDPNSVFFSQAVNLTRNLFKDKINVSSITAQTSDKVSGAIPREYVEKNLGLKIKNIPEKVEDRVKITDNSKRNPRAHIIVSNSVTTPCNLHDIFDWQTTYKYTNSASKIYQSELIPKTGYHGGKYGCGSYSYNVVEVGNDVGVDNGNSDGTVTYTMNEQACKYLTDTIDIGINKETTVRLDKEARDDVTNGNTEFKDYRFAFVNASAQTLSFYPEIYMQAYYAKGDTISSHKTLKYSEYNKKNDDRSAESFVKPYQLLVMGEEKRQVQPSSLYIAKLVQDNPADKSAIGKTLSDDTATGSKADSVSGGKPVVYAGGNVSLDLSSNLKLSMYGYTLDLVDASVDTTIKNVGSYSKLIADNSPIRSIWDNDNTKYKPQDEFDNWMKNTLNNLAVDMTLRVNSSDGSVDKRYNNFNVSLGNLGVSTLSSEKTDTYSLSLAHGKLLDTASYNSLLEQIKADYNCNSLSDAKEVFERSGIYQSILDSIESDSSDCNKSDGSKAVYNKDKQAITNEHWYDERVKTFVVRRYKHEGISLKNITVSDKIDYDAAPTGKANASSNDGYKSATAKWYMTLYLKDLPDALKTNKDKNVDTSITDSETGGSPSEAGVTDASDTTDKSLQLYNPKDYKTLVPATKAGTVLAKEVYVSGADFVIPSASTYDMGN